MNPAVEVFMLGAEGERSAFSEPAWPAELRLIPTGIATLAGLGGSPCAAELASGETELVAVTTGTDREALRGVAVMALLLDSDRENAASLCVKPIESPPRSAFNRIDVSGVLSGIGLLLTARADHGPFVVRRSKLREIGRLRPVAEPLWDWVIRAARAGEKVNTWPVDVSSIPCSSRLPLLVPPARGPEADWLREHLTERAIDELTSGHSRCSAVDDTAFRAGLYQWHDFMNESHELCQSIEGKGDNRLGDYWHAILHRREPDYSNAKYWFRQIGNQPTYRELRHMADSILAGSNAPEASRWRDRLHTLSKWDPFAFVDLCEECAADETSELALAARRIQYAEMSMLV
jgi:hypothetical protein